MKTEGSIGRAASSLACVVALGCASALPAPPAPVDVEAVPALRSPFPFPTTTPRLAAPPPPAPPLAAPRIDWWPVRPRQASVVRIGIRQPGGPPLEDVSVRVAGRPIRLVPAAGGWTGIAGLPLDSAGFYPIDLRFRRRGRIEVQAIYFPVEPRTFPSTRIRISAGASSDPAVEARIARERMIIRSALASSGDIWYPREPFGWPRPPERTSPFGQRRMFNGEVRSRHLGLDLRGRRGTPVRAPADGRVLLTGNFYFQGNAVYVDHGLGLVTAYFHFSSTAVREGEVVRKGQVLGRVGSTGRSTAPHLHWSAYVAGENIDPESLVGFELPAVEPVTGALEPATGALDPEIGR